MEKEQKYQIFLPNTLNFVLRLAVINCSSFLCVQAVLRVDDAPALQLDPKTGEFAVTSQQILHDFNLIFLFTGKFQAVGCTIWTDFDETLANTTMATATTWQARDGLSTAKALAKSYIAQADRAPGSVSS